MNANTPDFEQWYRAHRGAWNPRIPQAGGTFIRPEAILGEEDGAQEWQHRAEAERTFVHIPSYEALKKKDVLFLFGRRGTGKTTMIRMLQHEVRQQAVEGYGSCSVLVPVELANQLALQIQGSYLRDLPEKELVQFLKQCWACAIQMAFILDTAFAVPGIRVDHINAIAKAFGLREGMQVLRPAELSSVVTQYVVGIVSSGLAECTSQNDLARTITSIQSQISSVEIRELDGVVKKHLRQTGGLALVLVDSEELYVVRDRVAMAITTALMDAVLDVYSRYETGLYVAKAALPSEIYPHLRPINKEKTEGKSLFILWAYKDLVTLLAKRFMNYLDGRPSSDELRKVEIYSNARKYVYEIVPPQIISRNGLRFDTLSYIIRHTQKKPRQIIELMNTILTLASRDGLTPASEPLPPKYVTEGVHARLDMLVDGTLDIYKDIYPDAAAFIRRTLSRARSHFEARALDKLLKEVSALRNKHDLSRDDLKRLFLEAGVLGIAHKVQQITPAHDLLEAVFEYQVKGTLHISQDAVCVVHPMFFEELQTIVDHSVFSYPLPYEQEERQVIEAAGLRVG